MRQHLDKLGSIGSVVAAAACPICFPKLALLGGLLGLGAFSAYEAQLFMAAQLLVVVSVTGQALAYRRHRNVWPFAAALAGGAGGFFGPFGFSSGWRAHSRFFGARSG